MIAGTRNVRPQLNVSSLGVFSVLSTLARSDQSLGVLELARRLEIPPSTAYRALATLEKCDFVTQEDSSSKYCLGNAARRTIAAFFNMFPIRSASMIYLRRLALLTGQTTALWVRIGPRMVKIATIEGNPEIIGRRPIGQWSPVDQCVPGLAVIAANLGLGAKRNERLNNLLVLLKTTGFVWDASSDPNEYSAPVVPPQRRVFASVAIEGGTRSAFYSYKTEARKIIESLEQNLASSPQAAYDPFAHLDENGTVLMRLAGRVPGGAGVGTVAE